MVLVSCRKEDAIHVTWVEPPNPGWIPPEFRIYGDIAIWQLQPAPRVLPCLHAMSANIHSREVFYSSLTLVSLITSLSHKFRAALIA